MKCERCKFENIPGQNTCVKCGSILETESEQIEICPPRMSKWKKPIRYLSRLIRKGVAPLKNIELNCPARITQVSDDILIGLFLSVIPGFAHLMQRRFKEIRWYFLIWLALLISGLFLFGSQAGFICLGLAIGVHTTITVQYKILKELEGIGKKLVMIILILIALTIIYSFSPRILIPNLTGGYSNMSAPYQKIAIGDYLLGWRNLKQNTALERGDLVFMHPEYFGTHMRQTYTGRELIVGQIVGLAGEQLEIKGGVFAVNGQQLDSKIYPIPQWLRINEYSVIIPERNYFISVQYNVNVGHNMALESTQINLICIRKAEDIRSRVFMRWWPLARRGFIR
jgi:hypothetical protein